MKKLITIILVKVKENSVLTVGTVAVINLLLALVALIRDISMAAYLGTSSPADALLLAYFLPDTVGNLLLGGAIGLACVPTFSSLYVSGQMAKLRMILRRIALSIFLLALFLTVIFVVFRGPLTANLGKGFTSETLLLCRQLFLLILPTLLLFPLVAIGSALLQTFNRFTVPALAPVFFNMVFLAGILFPWLQKMALQKGVYIAASSITLGVLAMAALVWGAVYQGKVLADNPQPTSHLPSGSSNWDREYKEILVTFVCYLAVLLTGQSVLYVERYLASQLGEGSIAALSYAYRLSQFPIWVFVAAVGAVILPEMSRNMELQNSKALRKTLTRSVTLVLTIAMPVTVLLYVLKVPIVSTLLERGAFNSRSLAATAGVLAGYSLSITGTSLVFILLRYFLARRQMLLPLLASLFSVSANIAADYILVATVGISGLGYGAFLGSILNAGLLILLAKQQVGFSVLKGVETVGKILAANLILLTITVTLQYFWNLLIPQPQWYQNVILLILTGSLGGTAYFIVLNGLNLLSGGDVHE